MVKQSAINFGDYLATYWTPNGRKGCWDSIEMNDKGEPKYIVDSTEEVFELFLNYSKLYLEKQ